MFETIQLLSLGVAAGIDTLLLVALLAPTNRRLAPMPVLLVILGTWLWHAGLVALLLSLFADPWAGPMRSLAFTAACAGALLTPCATCHCIVRLWHSGLALYTTPRPRHLLAYLPLLLLPWCIGLEPGTTHDPFRSVAGMTMPYLLWSGAVNVAAGATFVRFAAHVELAVARRFFRQLAVLAFVRTAIHLGVHLVLPDEPYARLLVYLSPILSTTLFGYFILRNNILDLTLERSFVYAGIAALVFLAHQLLFVALAAALPPRAQVLLVVVEVVLLTGLILAVRTWRVRVAEALSYLARAHAPDIRARLGELATLLSSRSERPPLEVLDWFTDNLRRALDVEFVSGWLIGPGGAVLARCGRAESHAEVPVRRLIAQMRSAALDACTHHVAPSGEVCSWIQSTGVALAILKSCRDVTGLLLIGRHARNRELTAEETGAVRLLAEQLVITLDNGMLQAERQGAERRAAHGEKLAALGLLAGAVAHEVKNPLSAIKTIATVLAEELGAHDAHAEDLRLIVGETDRLARTITQLLDVARPRVGEGEGDSGCVATAWAGTLGVLRHRARQGAIDLEVRIAPDLPRVRGGDQALHEIFFNLLSNALDAAGPRGRVAVVCTAAADNLLTEVRDDGPGLPAAIRERLFEPFLSTKAGGTGLGLHVVGRRVRELGGSIACDSAPERGTTFSVRLPISSDVTVLSPSPPASGGEGRGEGDQNPSQTHNVSARDMGTAQATARDTNAPHPYPAPPDAGGEGRTNTGS